MAIREYQTDADPADYILFVNGKLVGLIEAKREEGVRLTTVEEQTSRYSSAKLKYIDNDPLQFVYESTGELTRFTDYRDLKSRSRPVFTFHRPETFKMPDDNRLFPEFYGVTRLSSPLSLSKNRCKLIP